MVAYDQRVREKAMSNPAPSAGPSTRSPPTPEPASPSSGKVSDLVLRFGREFFFVTRRREPTSAATLISSATTSVHTAQASAAKIAEAKLTRAATLPQGMSEAT